MNIESILSKREKFYYEMLEYYQGKANKDARYKAIYENFKNGKEKFLSGWTTDQVIRGRRDVR